MALWLVLPLAGCGPGGGSGGGSGGSSSPDPLQVSRSEDDVPTGARIDLAAKRCFPMSPGDTWLYAFAYASSNAIDAPFW
ncbi:MAG: hypothetical protein ACK5XG_05230, partial [Burkholderiales bacterium]